MEKIYDEKLSIKAWAKADMPREKLLSHGRRTLSDAELMAILIGSGNRTETSVDLSRRILHAFQNDLNRIGKLDVADLLKFKGIGEAKAISIIAALELGRRRNEVSFESQNSINCPNDTYQLFRPHFQNIQHEEFWILTLNRGNKPINKYLISKGGISETPIDAKIIFKEALQQNASSIILAHNHPSGNLYPSNEDIIVTKKLCDAAKLLDIIILDHLIITDKHYYSFKDHNHFNFN